MSLELTDIKNFEDLTAISTIAADDIFPMVDISVPDDKKISFKTLAQHLNYLGDGVYLVPERRFLQEKTSAAQTTSGWKTIAELAPVAGTSSSGFLLISASTGGETLLVAYSIRNTDTPHITLKIIGSGAYNSPLLYLKGIRFGYGANATGCTVQLNYGATGGSITVALLGNSSWTTDKAGLQLVEPYDDTGLCPDGDTVATYMEAGSTFDLDLSGSTWIPPLWVRYNSDDTLQITGTWPEIPKPNHASMTLTLPSTSLYVVDGSGDGTVHQITTGDYSLGTPVFNGRLFRVLLTQTGVGASLVPNIAHNLQISGTGCKLTLGE